MTPIVLFYLIVGIVILDYFLDQTLSFLNRKAWTNVVPQELNDIYDASSYVKSQHYNREHEDLNFITSTFSFLLLLLMFAFSGFALLDHLVRTITDHEFFVTILFFGILFFASDILSIPFSIYGIFKIEEKYGFNKITAKLYVIDKLKGYLLAVILGGCLLFVFIWFYRFTGAYFWIYVWIIVTVFMILMIMFYSNLIVPLFNKQTPLEAGELKMTIEDFCKKAGFILKDVYVIDGSKRSTKANAYFTGLGAKKRIVLYDTLIKQLSIQEIIAVLAHEIGHYKHKHTLSSLGFSILQNGLTLYILSLLINNPILAESLGVEKSGIHIGLIVFGILYSPISTALSVIINIISRKNEYQADQYAASYGLAKDLIGSLKKLSKNNLSNLTPHRIYVFFHYSHPTLLQRIKKLTE